MARARPGNMLQFVDSIQNLQQQHHTDLQRLWRRMSNGETPGLPGIDSGMQPVVMHVVLLQQPLHRGRTSLAYLDETLITVQANVWSGYGFAGDWVLVGRFGGSWMALGAGATYVRAELTGGTLVLDEVELPFENPWEAPPGSVGADWDERASKFVINDWQCPEEEEV